MRKNQLEELYHFQPVGGCKHSPGLCGDSACPTDMQHGTEMARIQISATWSTTAVDREQSAAIQLG